MRRLYAFCALFALAACQAPAHYGVAEEAVAAPVMEAAPAKTDCAPGEGDGIGGTGCQID